MLNGHLNTVSRHEIGTLVITETVSFKGLCYPYFDLGAFILYSLPPRDVMYWFGIWSCVAVLVTGGAITTHHPSSAATSVMDRLLVSRSVVGSGVAMSAVHCC